MPSHAPKLVMTLLAVGVSGCVPSERAGFEATAPNKRLEAIVHASGDADPASLTGLVGQLESSDPAARLLAIRALERRTGMTLGYHHSDPEWKRRAAIDRWKDHLAPVSAADSGDPTLVSTEPRGPSR